MVSGWNWALMLSLAGQNGQLLPHARVAQESKPKYFKLPIVPYTY